MAGESTPKGVDISTGKGIGGEAPIDTSTQTRESEAGKEGGDTTTNADDDKGAGTGEGGSAGGDGGADALTPDKDGKVTHPESKELVEPIVVATYYRDQFAASTRGAQELLTKISTADEAHKGEIGTLTKKVEELTKLAEGKNPEGLSALEIKDKLEQTTRELVVLKETQNLDAFEKTNPLATGKQRESLKALARANPTTALQDLWDTHLKPGAEATAAADKAKKDALKKGAGEKGKGTSTREPASSGTTVAGSRGDTGLTLAEFNAKPVAERRALMEKYGING